MSDDKTSLHVKITEEQYEWLRTQSYERNKSQAQIVRELIDKARKEK